MFSVKVYLVNGCYSDGYECSFDVPLNGYLLKGKADAKVLELYNQRKEYDKKLAESFIDGLTLREQYKDVCEFSDFQVQEFEIEE
jgi:hypothetical protein